MDKAVSSYKIITYFAIILMLLFYNLCLAGTPIEISVQLNDTLYSDSLCQDRTYSLLNSKDYFDSLIFYEIIREKYFQLQKFDSIPAYSIRTFYWENPPLGAHEIYFVAYYRNIKGCLESIKMVSKSIIGKRRPLILDSINIYPNPTNSNITFNIIAFIDSKVSLNIYNILGQKLRTLYIDPIYGNSIVWDMKNDEGNIVTSGIYFVRFYYIDSFISKKFIILK